jgi:hypothetical protein
MSKLPVLQYNQLEPVLFDDFTERPGNFWHHMRILKEHGYNTISCQLLIDYFSRSVPLPMNPVLITFDVGYLINFQFAPSILRDFGYSATFFVVGEYVLKSSCGDPEYKGSYLTIENLHELRLHGYSHKDYKSLSLLEIKLDIEKNISFLNKIQLQYTKAFAFTHEFRAKNTGHTNGLSALLSHQKIQIGFYTENKINKIDKAGRYTLRRICINEFDSEKVFLKKLRAGKGMWFW